MSNPAARLEDLTSFKEPDEAKQMKSNMEAENARPR